MVLIKQICLENPQIIQNSFSEKRYSVLHFACEIENKRAVKALLEEGFNPNVLTANNDTVLMYMFLNKYYYPLIEKNSFKLNRKSIIKLLIDYGIDCDIAAKDDFCKLYSYQINNSEHEITPLMLACSEGDFNCVELMIQEGKADVNVKTENGATPLVFSLVHSKLEISKLLLCKYHADATRCFLINGENYKPVSLLRNLFFSLKSKNFKLKKEIVDEFKKQGIDYYNEPVPETVKEAVKELLPDTWEEYIKVY